MLLTAFDGGEDRHGYCLDRSVGTRTPSRPKGVTVKILLDDGTQIDLSGVDQKQLEMVLDRRTPSGH